MFDKRLLIAPVLVISTVVAGTIYLSSDKNTSQLTVSADQVVYSATIDATNPLISTGSESSYYAFELNNPGAYGGFYVSDTSAINTNLPKDKKDYAFSWTTSLPKYFQIMIDRWQQDAMVQGVSRTLWGFPGARKVEIVYNDGGTGIYINTKPKQSSEWDRKDVDLGNGEKKVTCENTGTSAFNSYWSTSLATAGTIYVRSMTVWYTCD